MGRSPSATTIVAGVIGSPIRHSLSPAIVGAAFEALDLDWTFVAFDVAPGGAAGALDAMRSLGLGGLSVNMPAVLLMGSIVTSIIVSERGGPLCTSRSRASRPMKRILMRLAPSQVGGSAASGIVTGGGGKPSEAMGVP